MPYRSLAQAFRFHRDPQLRRYAAEWDEATVAEGIRGADLPTRVEYGAGATPRRAVEVARRWATEYLGHSLRRGRYYPVGRSVFVRSYQTSCVACGRLLSVRAPSDEEFAPWVADGSIMTTPCGYRARVELDDGTVVHEEEWSEGWDPVAHRWADEDAEGMP